jgi:hypothetical protein
VLEMSARFEKGRWLWRVRRWHFKSDVFVLSAAPEVTNREPSTKAGQFQILLSPP